MNKNKFNSVVNQPEGISEEDRNGLDQLAKTYPYSQIIHALAARAHAEAKTPVAKSTLNHAAMYVADRQVLKELITHVAQKQPEKIIAVETKEVQKQVTADNAESKSPKQKKIEIDTSSFSEDISHLRSEIWEDLEKLKLSKAHYLEAYDKAELTNSTSPSAEVKAKKKGTTIAKPKSPSTKTATKKTTSSKASSSSKASTPKTGGKSKAKGTAASSGNSKKVTASKKTPTTKKKSSSKIETKQKEQIKLIDDFIGKEPSISSKPVAAVSSEQRDLSENSTNFGDDLISENLAIILVDQGKTQKAIEMYKKLIWKFPQKKAYFAAQIEKLTK